MRVPLAIGYTFIALMSVSLLSLFWLVDLFPEQARDSVVNASWAAFFLCYAGLWLWMLFDHLFAESKDYVALIAILLVVGGGIAGIAYFFMIFRPRVLAQGVGAGSPGVGV